MRYALTLFAFIGFAMCASAQAQRATNLLARVQVDLTTPNRALALALSNTLAVAVGTNAPRAERTAPIQLSAEPGGLFRLHALYEYEDFQSATNLFAVTRLQQVVGLSGRIVIYCQPEEFTRLTDWAGADRDPRAKRTELAW